MNATIGKRLWFMWTEAGEPFIGYFKDGVRVYVRPATDEDREALTNGLLSYDSQRDPTSRAWAAHVAAGGD